MATFKVLIKEAYRYMVNYDKIADCMKVRQAIDTIISVTREKDTIIGLTKEEILNLAGILKKAETKQAEILSGGQLISSTILENLAGSAPNSITPVTQVTPAVRTYIPAKEVLGTRGLQFTDDDED